MVITDRQRELRDWLMSKIPAKFDDLATFIGLESKGDIIACVCYEGYNKASVKCHIAIDGRITRDFLWYIFHYPFNEMNVKKIITIIDSFNAKSLKFVSHLGFITEAIIKDAVVDGDSHVLTMTKEQCKFLK